MTANFPLKEAFKLLDESYAMFQAAEAGEDEMNNQTRYQFVLVYADGRKEYRFCNAATIPQAAYFLKNSLTMQEKEGLLDIECVTTR